jgi:predicted nucleotidyltransferase
LHLIDGPAGRGFSLVFTRSGVIARSAARRGAIVARYAQSLKGLDIIKNANYNEIMDVNIPFMDKILSLIVSLVSPDQIILFGSYARGDNTEKSDIDLLITKKDLRDSNEMTDLLYRAFYNNKIGIPVDLIVMDYNKYLKLNNEIGYIYKTIKQEGKLIYGTL